VIVAALLLVGSVAAAPDGAEAQSFQFGQACNTTGPSFPTFPSINGNGTRIVFASNGNPFPPNLTNPDGNFEAFYIDLALRIGGRIQITSSTGPFGSFDPKISTDGTRIVFSSDRDLTPGSPGNADGSTELFLYDVASASLTQITNSAAELRRPR
jgi:Tol biopolymer transport system component